MTEDIPALNLFMMMRELNRQALRPLPDGYTIRPCHQLDYPAWKDLHVDLPEQAEEYHRVLDSYFELVYAPFGDLFFKRCRLVCDSDGRLVASGFIWKAYGSINTFHWLKVLRSEEGKGIGRGLLSALFRELAPPDYPVYLHTHPSSYRAVKLYSDFGFQLLSDPLIGYRTNHLEASLPYLEKYMPAADYANLRITTAPTDFLTAAAQTEYEQF